MSELASFVQDSARQRAGSLEVFHLQWPVDNGPAYVTLDEALVSHWIEIIESIARHSRNQNTAVSFSAVGNQL